MALIDELWNYSIPVDAERMVSFTIISNLADAHPFFLKGICYEECPADDEGYCPMLDAKTPTGQPCPILRERNDG